MDKRKNNGGHKSSGRKKLEDKKQAISIYVRGSLIDKLGGKDYVREILNNYIKQIEK